MTTPKMPTCEHCGSRYEQDRRGHCAKCGAPLKHKYILDYFTETEQRFVIERVKYYPVFDAKGNPTHLWEAVGAVLP